MQSSSHAQPVRHPAPTSTPNPDLERLFEQPGSIDLSKLRENTAGLNESTLLDLIENQQKDADYQLRAIEQSLALEMNFMPPRLPGSLLPSKMPAWPVVSKNPANGGAQAQSSTPSTSAATATGQNTAASAYCLPPLRNIV